MEKRWANMPVFISFLEVPVILPQLWLSLAEISLVVQPLGEREEWLLAYLGFFDWVVVQPLGEREEHACQKKPHRCSTAEAVLFLTL